MYEAMLRGEECVVSVLQRTHPEVLPTWCRARSGDGCPAARTLFGTQRVIKAHDVQTDVHCRNDVCYTDIGMSRAFRGPRAPARLGYLRVRDGELAPVHFNATYEVRKNVRPDNAS